MKKTKTIAKPKTPATGIVLTCQNVPGVDPDTGKPTPTKYAELHFTMQERKTALAIAQKWFDKGRKPFVYTTNYGGKVQTLFNSNTRTKKKAA